MKNICKISTKEYLYIINKTHKEDFFSNLTIVLSDICIKREIVMNEQGNYLTSSYWRLIPLLILLIPFNFIDFCETAWYSGISEFKLTSFKDGRTPLYANVAYKNDVKDVLRYKEILKKKGIENNE